MSIFKTLIKHILGKGAHISYSQQGEDLVMRPYLKGANPFYVDVGCYHPMLYSNTYRLYRQGWSGIVIDPNLGLRRLYRIFRPRDVFVHAGVGPSGERTYFEFTDGAYNTFDTASAEAYKEKTKLARSYPVRIRPLHELIGDVKRIGLLNLDVEGMDLQVLESYDWRVYPSVIVVEASPNSPVHQLLAKRGYELVGLTGLNLILRHAGASPKAG